MIKRAFAVTCVAAVAATCVQPAAAAPWVQGYTVGYYSQAFRYAGRNDFERGSYIQPGADCPRGSTVDFSNPKEAARAFSMQSWRTPAEVDALADPPATENRQQAGIYYYVWHDNSAYRGFRKDIQTFVNPFAADDPGQLEVTSRIGEGFNLDGKVSKTDFISPDGEKGIDNALYRSWGCLSPWRGDGNATMDLRANDKMQGGLFTIVIRLSGNKDPMNDDAATLEVGYSPDAIMKDSLGRTGTNYSYRILKSSQYTKLKAKIRNGVVETEQAPVLHMPEIAWFPNQNRDANFRQGKFRLVMNPDGTATGLVGGYRDWRDVYSQDVFPQSGGTQAVREHEDPIGMYYALRRNADGLYNPKTHRFDGISSAYRMKLAKAFVVDPPKPMAVPPPPVEGERGSKAFADTIAAMIKGTDTLIPQPPPPGSNEARADSTQPKRPAAKQAANDADKSKVAVAE